MKRLLFVLIACLSLMCGCNEKSNDDTSLPSVDKERDVQKVQSAFYIKGELPDIGSFSALGKYNRFYDKYTPHFIPSDEYGKIIPFVGSAKVYETPKIEDSSYSASAVYSSYGFCTPDGRVVMDPNSKIKYLTYKETNDGFGYYQYSLDVSDEDYENYDVYAPSNSVIVPQSGKWCLELERGSWVTGAANGYIVVMWVSEDNGEEFPTADSVRVYDYDGKLVCELKDRNNADIVSGGVLLLHDYSMEGDGYPAEFVNFNGERVFEPYAHATPFNEYGVASVRNLNDESYLMDVNGNRLTEGKYKSIDEIYGSFGVVGFQARHAANERKSDIFSLDGIYLETIDGSGNFYSIRMYDDRVIYYYHNDSEEIYKYADGTPFVSKELGVSPNQYVNADGVFVHRDEDTKKAVVFDINGETMFSLDELEYMGSLNEDRSFAIYSTGRIKYEWNENTQANIVTNTEKQHVYDIKNNKIVLSLDGSGYGEFVGKNDRYIILRIDTTDGMFSSVYSCYLYDTVTNEMLFEDCMHIEYHSVGGEDYFNVCTENQSTLYDSSFKVLLKTINE